jgi:hypothetical protein
MERLKNVLEEENVGSNVSFASFQLCFLPAQGLGFSTCRAETAGPASQI